MSVKVTEGRIPEFGLHHRMQLAMENVGMGVQEMADYLDMSRNSVSRWINGHGKPPRVVLMVWADATDVPYEWLEKGLAPAVEPGPDAARSEGLEPPTFWLVVSRAVRRVLARRDRGRMSRGARPGPVASVYSITTGERVA